MLGECLNNFYFIFFRPNYNRSSPLYMFISTILRARNSTGWAMQAQVPLYLSQNVYVFARGNAALIALTNVGANGLQGEILVPVNGLWADGQSLCNV